MEQQLYESKGGSKKFQKFNLVCAIILIIGGILFCILSQHIPGNVHTTLFLFGVAACIFAIILFTSIQRYKKCYLKIFENHVEGFICGGILQPKFNLTFHEIEDAQLTQTMLYTVLLLQTKSTRYTVTLDNNDGEEAFHLIKERIN